MKKSHTQVLKREDFTLALRPMAD